VAKPAIALRRREEAIRKFSFKLNKLEELLDLDKVDQVPQKMRPTNFVEWDDEELGVEKFSRNSLYETDEEYIVLIERMKLLLALLAKKRAAGSKKENQIKKLREQLEAAERKAQAFVNDYTAVRAKLDEAERKMEVLRLQVQRMKENRSKIVPLKSVKLPENNED
jgi:hypothetical protein